jgi:isoamylase
VKDLVWFTPDGREMSEEDWRVGYAKSLGVFLHGASIQRPGEHGERVKDDSFYVIFNGHHEPLQFTLPAEPFGTTWIRVLDTSSDDPPELRRGRRARTLGAEASIEAKPRTILVLRRSG